MYGQKLGSNKVRGLKYYGTDERIELSVRNQSGVIHYSMNK